MSKPEFWWCEKSDTGKLIHWTTCLKKKDVIFYHCSPPRTVVRIRIEEVGRKK